MFRRSLFLLVAMPLALAISGILDSCGPLLRYDGYVCSILLRADFDASIDTPEVTASRHLVVEARAQSVCFVPPPKLINSAYAMTKCAVWKNGIDSTSFDLRLDRDLIVESDTIPANTNLLARESFARYTKFSKRASECKALTYELPFPSELLNAMGVDTNVYLLALSCRTTDNKPLSDTLPVLFRK